MNARRLRCERGVTVVETLIACVLTLLVTGTGLAVLEGAYRHNDEMQRRSEAMQQGRGAMDQVVSGLRSQVCLDPSTPPVVSATDKRLTYYADSSDASSTSIPDKHTLSLDGGVLTDKRYKGAPGAVGQPPVYTSPPVVRRLGVNLAQSGASPVLSYYGYGTGTPQTPATADVPLPVNVSGPEGLTADPARIARIVVTLQANPPGRVTGTKLTTTLHDEAFVRIADPTTTIAGPQCS